MVFSIRLSSLDTSPDHVADWHYGRCNYAMKIFTLATEPAGTQIEAIEHGLPGSTLKEIVTVLGVSQKVLAVALGLAPRTVAQRTASGKRFSIGESERLLRVARVCNLAGEVFSSEEAVSGWMTEPDSTLGDRTPLSMLGTDVGSQKVENLLRAMIHGVPI